MSERQAHRRSPAAELESPDAARGLRGRGAQLRVARLPRADHPAGLLLDGVRLVGHDRAALVSCALPDGRGAALPLRPERGACIRQRQGHRVRHVLRQLDPRHASCRRPPDGCGGRPSLGAGLSHGGLQARRCARCNTSPQLDRGDRAAAVHLRISPLRATCCRGTSWPIGL